MVGCHWAHNMQTEVFCLFFYPHPSATRGICEKWELVMGIEDDLKGTSSPMGECIIDWQTHSGTLEEEGDNLLQ